MIVHPSIAVLAIVLGHLRNSMRIITLDLNAEHKPISIAPSSPDRRKDAQSSNHSELDRLFVTRGTQEELDGVN